MHTLLVCYAWPPTGGGGVERVLKLSKFLPDHGVKCSVLTVANPSVPLRDESLLRDLRPEMNILRARTLEPGYSAKQTAWQISAERQPNLLQRTVKLATAVAQNILIPDPQLLWQPDAQRVLAQWLWRAEPNDVVFISGPPFSQFLLAPLVRFKRGTKVVLDYRDEWITYRETYEMMGRAARWVGGPLEHLLLKTAHEITTATSAFRDHLLARFPFLQPGRIHAIPNGYDPDDLPTPLPEPPKDRFVLTYAGTVFRLTSPRGLLGALTRLQRDDPELAKLLRVRFIGRIVDTELPAIEAANVERIGFLPKAQALRELACSQMVTCLLDDVPGAERIYPAKVFELMYLGRPCLTLAPPGALSELAHRHRLGPVLPPRDEVAIASELARALRAFRDGHYTARSAVVDIKRYDRRALAGEFAEIFRDL